MPEDDEMDDDDGGVFMEKEDVQLIYNALKKYKPTTAKEDQLRDIWLEEFDMMLVVNGYPLKAGQLTYDCRYSTMHGMPVTGGRGFERPETIVV